MRATFLLFKKNVLTELRETNGKQLRKFLQKSSHAVLQIIGSFFWKGASIFRHSRICNESIRNRFVVVYVELFFYTNDVWKKFQQVSQQWIWMGCTTGNSNYEDESLCFCLCLCLSGSDRIVSVFCERIDESKSESESHLYIVRCRFGWMWVVKSSCDSSHNWIAGLKTISNKIDGKVQK